jgi:uncharacterized protein
MDTGGSRRVAPQEQAAARRTRRAVIPAAIAALAAIIALAGCMGAAGSAQGQGSAGSAGAQLAAATGGAVAGSEGITVVGEGRIQGRPDTVEATVGVEVVRGSVQEALDAASAAASDVLGALEEAGVDPADIQTTDVSVIPQRVQPEPEQPPTTEGYLAANRIRVTIEGVEEAGSVLEQAVAAAGDAATLDSFQLALRQDAELVRRAREEALAHARDVAEQYAQIAGVDLGELVALTETGGAGAVPLAADVAREAASAPIAPGTQDVTVRVTATWALP